MNDVKIGRHGILALAVAIVACVCATEQEGPIVRNGGFEDMKDGVPVGWCLGPKHVCVDGAGRNGTRALMFENDDPNLFAYSTYDIKLKAGKSYKFAMWVRTELLKRDTGGAGICIAWSAGDGLLGGACTPDLVKGTQDWTRIEYVTQLIPRDMQSFFVAPVVDKGTVGRVWFDDVSVVEIDAAEMAKSYRKLAEQGDANMQFNLGECYCRGIGVETNAAEAVKWWRKSAKQGNSDAQCNLGLCYECGIGVETNAVEAVKWYRVSAERGNMHAQCCLGECYSKGVGVETNAVEAVKWYRLSAEQGDSNAQYCLGVCYECGRGVEKDEEEARKWYFKSAEQGNPFAQLYCAILVGKERVRKTLLRPKEAQKAK